MLPLLPYFLAYLGGLLSALPPAIHFFFPYALPAGTAASGILIYSRRKNRSLWKWTLLLALIAAGYFAPGWNDRFQPANHILNHLDETRRATVVGVLIASPEQLPDKTDFHIDLKEIRYKGTAIAVTGRARLRHYTPDQIGETLQAGDRIRFSNVRLKRPRNFKNPGRFDYKGYLEQRGIWVIGSLAKNSAIEKLGSSKLPFPKSLQAKVRGALLESMNRHFPGEEGALLKAMLLGEKNSLSEKTRETYIATGLSHLMAVSGLHVGFVAFAAFACFWPLAFYGCLKYRPEWAQSGMARKIAVAGCFLPILFYLMVVGAKVTALRAGFLILVFLVAILLNRQRSMLNTLVIAAFLILIWNPKAVLDVSFQLSFAAMLSILLAHQYYVQRLSDPIDRMGEVSWLQKHLGSILPEEWRELNLRDKYSQTTQRFFAGSLFVSVAVFLGTLPFIIFHFHQVSLIVVLLNLIMVPLASVLIPLTLFAVSLATVFPILGELLSWPLHYLLQTFLWIPQFFAAFPYASVYVPSPPKIWIVFYYSLLIIGTWLAVQKPETSPTFTRPARPFELSLKISLGIASLGVILWLFLPRWHERSSEVLTVSILDVGQGESIFIEFPNRETMILDGGGFYKNSLDVGKAVVAPFLWNRGIGQIDYLAATHSDNDHISGLESLAELFPIEHFLDGFQGLNDYRINRLRQKVLGKNAELIPFHADSPLTIGEVRLLPLHPDPGFVRRAVLNHKGRAGNELSLVIRLEYRDFSMLLTGDIGASTEEYLIEHAAPLKAQFLKSPHHGSRFSNSPRFIHAVQPNSVIFSSGYLNWMRHPHPEVIHRYEAQGTQIWRTDLNGSIHITSDGYRHQIQNYPGRDG